VFYSGTDNEMPVADLADRPQVLLGVDHGWHDWQRWQKFAAMLRHCITIPVGEAAKVADLDESTGQHVQ
jgi:hypothetical protein